MFYQDLRRRLKELDARFLASSIAQRRIRRAENARRAFLERAYGEVGLFGIASATSLLPQLCDLYGSDKGSVAGWSAHYPWPPHNYTEVYSLLFEHCRDSVRLVFECGIGTTKTEVPANMSLDGQPGASLRVWRDYFPNARVFGADIDRGVLFSEDRISTCYVDQTDPNAIRDMWAQINLDGFDLMIDDGRHDPLANVTLLQGSFERLRNGGLYVIEDVHDRVFEVTLEMMGDLSSYATAFILQRSAHDYVPGNNLILLRKPMAG